MNIYIEYGSALPRPEYVLDANTAEHQDNPRGINQVEPKQLFIVLDSKNSVYWFTNIKKANLIQDFFDHFGIKCQLKNIYDSNDFIKNMQSINGLKLSSSPDRLFNTHSLNQNLIKDIFGYGASLATIQFSYSKDKFLDAITRKKFEDLFQERSSYSSFIISGRSDQGVDYVFNNETLLKRIVIEIDTPENGIYDQDIVFEQFREEAHEIMA